MPTTTPRSAARRRTVLAVRSALTGLLLAACVSRPMAEQARPNIPVVAFDIAFEATPPAGGPAPSAIAKAVSESLRGSLRASGYECTSFNADSAPIARALTRTHALGHEDLAHPEHATAARKIALAYGARYVIYPRLHQIIMSLEDGQARVGVVLRSVPDIGAEREVRGEGTAAMKPDLRSKTYAMRLLQQAIDAACRDAAKQFAAPAVGDDPSGQASAARSYFTEGQQRLRQNRLDLALPLLERASRLDPQNIEYSMALADAYNRGGQTASALMEYRRAVTMQPNSVDLRVRLARIYLQRSMVKEASAELRRASQIAPDHEDVRSTLIEVYLRNNMLEEAAAEYRRLAEARPEDAAVRLSLGDLQYRRGLLDEATEHYRSAAAIKADDPVPHERLIGLYRKRNMHREALREMILAQRTSAGADDAQRYRDIANALDLEAGTVLNESLKVLDERRKENTTREDAYTAVKALAARADAVTAEVSELKAPATLVESHRRRVFAYSLLTQSLMAYGAYYENAGAEEGANGDLLQAQAVGELKRAREAMGR